MLNAIGAAALCLMVVNPLVLFGASFQLTFLCVWLVAAVGVPILERTFQPFSRGLLNLGATEYDFSLPPKVVQFRLDLRMLADRLERFFGKRIPFRAIVVIARILLGGCELIVISAVMQVGLALPMAYYFHRATFMAMPANLLVVPLTELLMPAAALAVGLSYISVWLAKVPAWIAGLAVEGIAGTVRWLGGLQLADVRVPTPRFPLILAAIVGLALAMILVRRRPLAAAAGLFTLDLSAFWICIIPPRPQAQPGVLEVTAIDVGQGDSLLLISPQGRTMLVDAGGLPHWTHSELDVGEDVVSPYLWSRGFRRLDVLVLTHAHADHMGGMPAVLASFHPRELWIGNEPSEPELQPLLQKAHDVGVKVILRKAGDAVEFGGATVGILAPDPSSPAGRRNDESLVMKLTYGNTSALLEGDAEKASELQIAKAQPQADMLKVGHHGSNTSTVPQFLAAVHPRFAVISVGLRNGYGHPRGEVLSRLEAARVVTGRTDLDGAITLLGRQHRHDFSPRSPLMSISAVSSLTAACRCSLITRRASSASSSRTRITVPPTPGRMSCWASSEVTSESMPEASSRPCTIIASDSCSVSNTRTSFSFGFGRAAASGITPPSGSLETSAGNPALKF